jgi:hypothetical protein
LKEVEACVKETSAQVKETSARVTETSARVRETSAQVKETSASVDKISLRQDRGHVAVMHTLHALAEIAAHQTVHLDRQEGFVEESRAWRQRFEEDTRKRQHELLIRLNHLIKELGRPLN